MAARRRGGVALGKVKEAAYDPVRLYDYYMNKRLEGLPLAAIPEVQSYMRRHWIEYLLFLEMMESTRYPEEICDNESYQRDFLMYKIKLNIESPNIGLMLSDIYDYIAEHVSELDTEGYWEYYFGD